MGASRTRCRPVPPTFLIAILLGILFLCVCGSQPCTAHPLGYLPAQLICDPMPPSFQCVGSCGREFSKQANLTIHQKSCEEVRKDAQIAMEKRRARHAVAKVMTSKRSKAQRAQPMDTDLDRTHEPNPQAMTSTEAVSRDDDAIDFPDLGGMDVETSDPSFLPPDPDLEPRGHASSSSSTLPEPAVPPAIAQLTPGGLPYRSRRLPARFRDEIPDIAPVVVSDGHEEPIASGERRSRLPRVVLIVRDSIASAVNSFGLWREYPRRPSHDPDKFLSLNDLSNADPSHASDNPLTATETTPEDISPKPPWPFENMSQFLFMNYHHRPQGKSDAEGNYLLRQVIGHPEFKKEDLDGFSVEKGNRVLDRSEEGLKDTPWADGFKETSVEIEVPSGDKESPPQKLKVEGLHYRSIVSVIRAAFSETLALQFHFSPFRLWHQSEVTGEEQRVYSEIYNSDAFIDEHEEIQRHAPADPDDPSCNLEKVVAALMFWSDSTHLANFGTAKAWPIYMLFGNLSKYVRARPNSGACHHLAYIPSLPDSAHDWLSRFHTKWRTQKASILTFCRRELFHSIWKFLLDDEFKHAYIYGIVIDCADGIRRRVFPRIFTYSADYPEKVLLATIRDKGLCPCPRCMVPKSALDRMGLLRDIAVRLTRSRQYLMDTVLSARRFIYELAYSVNSAYVEALLKPISGTPTVNAFVAQLGPSFNLARMLVPDFMHEFELGVWKSIFTHLVRLLHAVKAGTVDELDRRYRQIPSFGRRTIRRFSTNASEMKKLAARDYEDLLQCAIPAFDGLFPEPHNTRLMTLLYTLAQWHALGKLRMHTDSTLTQLEKVTAELGRQIRKFRDLTCSHWDTVELDSEVRARRRREQAAEPAGSSNPSETPEHKVSQIL